MPFIGEKFIVRLFKNKLNHFASNAYLHFFHLNPPRMYRKSLDMIRLRPKPLIFVSQCIVAK